MAANSMKTRVFLLGLSSLLGMMLTIQYAAAAGNNHTLTRDDKAILAMRGTYMFSTKNIDDPKEIFTPDFVRHEQQFLTPEATQSTISELIKRQRKTYKVEDMLTEPVDVIVEGNKVAVRWVTNVQRSPDADTSEAPAHMKFTGVTISRIENGKIAEQWVYYDSNLVLTLTRLNYKHYFKETEHPKK
jgi:predicted ester cyclase